MSEVEGGFQVQADGLAGGIPGRLPPGAGQAERGVGHGGGGVRQPRLGPAAAAARGAPAAPLRVLAVAAEALGGAAAAGRVGAQRPPERQVAHPRVAGLLAGAARCRHAAQTCGAESGGWRRLLRWEHLAPAEQTRPAARGVLSPPKPCAAGTHGALEGLWNSGTAAQLSPLWSLARL